MSLTVREILRTMDFEGAKLVGTDTGFELMVPVSHNISPRYVEQMIRDKLIKVKSDGSYTVTPDGRTLANDRRF